MIVAGQNPSCVAARDLPGGSGELRQVGLTPCGDGSADREDCRLLLIQFSQDPKELHECLWNCRPTRRLPSGEYVFIPEEMRRVFDVMRDHIARNPRSDLGPGCDVFVTEELRNFVTSQVLSMKLDCGISVEVQHSLDFSVQAIGRPRCILPSCRLPPEYGLCPMTGRPKEACCLEHYRLAKGKTDSLPNASSGEGSSGGIRLG